MNNQMMFSLYAKIGFIFVLLSSIFQVFILNFGGFYISVFHLSSLFILPIAITQIRIIAWKPIFFFTAFIFIQILSFLWSPDVILGIKSVLNELIFIAILCLSIYIFEHHFVFFKKTIVFFFCMLLIPALTVVLFRLNPAIELSFLHSVMAKVLINPNSIVALLGDSPNNVFDDLKAGGFFINANVAAAYLGIAGFGAIGLARLLKYKSLKFIGATLVVCSLFTGSKAAALISFILICFIFRKNKYIQLFSPIILCLSSIITFLFITDLEALSASYIEASGSRFLIWEHFFIVLFENLALGQGYGGWAISFHNYASNIGIATGFPPHNTFINSWSESGLIALTALLLFYLFLFKNIIDVRNATNDYRAGASDTLMYCLLWLLFQGMGTNFGPIGEEHMFPLFAMYISILYCIKKDVKVEYSHF